MFVLLTEDESSDGRGRGGGGSNKGGRCLVVVRVILVNLGWLDRPLCIGLVVLSLCALNRLAVCVCCAKRERTCNSTYIHGTQVLRAQILGVVLVVRRA